MVDSLTVTGKNITLAMSLDVLLMSMIPLLVRIFVFGTFYKRLFCYHSLKYQIISP